MPVAILTNALILLIFGVAAILLAIDPDLYYRHAQEDALLEWLTFWTFLIASLRFLRTAASAWKSGHRFAWFTVGLGLFCFLVALEEISWGQRLFAYQPPDYFLARNYQQELNLHNVLSTDLRMIGLQLVVLGYGVALSLLSLLPIVRRLSARLRIVISPPSLIPAFLVMGTIYAWYPEDLTGEWVEAAMGLGFMGIAVMTAEPRTNQPSRRLALGVLSALLASIAIVILFASMQRFAAERIALTTNEVGLLASDFAGPKVHTRCGIHKRLYTFMREYNQPHLMRGVFAAQARTSGAETRAEFLLDPWNSPYWVRHKCEQGRAVAFVYSFGLNRRRDSTEWELGGDDIGAYFIGR